MQFNKKFIKDLKKKINKIKNLEIKKNWEEIIRQLENQAEKEVFFSPNKK